MSYAAEHGQSAAFPFPECGAMSQGYIGYHLQQSLQNELRKRGMTKDVATIVTQIVVDPADTAFQNPTKPIGAFYTREEADSIAEDKGYIFKEDAGRGWRQVVPSPTPKRIVELNSIKTLIEANELVIAGGGGRVPVVETEEGLKGVPAVIDKDRSSALLADNVGADKLIILTFLVNNGVESASFVNTIGTFCKVVPLIMFVIICIVSFKGGMFTADFWGRVANNLSKGTTTGGLWPQMKGTLMTLIWVFIGVEGASVMGARAKSLNEAKQATMLGFVLLLVFYMIISILPYGSLTRAQLASAAQPALGNDLKMIVGDWGMMIINIGLIISTIVSWLSWTMLPAETMLLIAEDGAAPKFWGKLNSKKAPTNALFTTAILQTIFLFSLLFTNKAYEFCYTLASSAILFLYLFVGLYQMKFSREHKE
ncbi:hypothetical protein ME797_15940 [Lactobacillus delbrueckii]|nr:hypothetical protein ME797_15940 [Lactobacillus delbrueckii]